MDSVPFLEEAPHRKVSVIGSELVENYTVYIIEVTDSEHSWTVKHRYSDFHDLHEKLTVEQKVDRRLLPPKKILGKNSKSLVEQRQKDLEVYLQTLLQQFPQATPTPLAIFLHFHLYEINGITAALAEELYHKGEQLLQAGQVFSLRPLQLYSISQQLRLAKPTCCSRDAKTDLGHILDFTCRLRYLKIAGTKGPFGTSSIEESTLPFDLSVFKSLLQMEISECSSQQIGGLSSLRSSLVTLTIHQSTDTMMSILVPEASEFSQWEAEGVEPSCPVTAIIPVWRNLTTLDMSYNHIVSIDISVKLISKVEFLDLSHNQLSSVENLQYLYNLVHVDLSYNNLRVLEAAHTHLGNIKTLSLAGNQLDRLTGLAKLFSLVNLDLSHNQLTQLDEIRNIGSLPCLEKLSLSGNPIFITPDYRTKVLAQFGDRAAEVCLDGDVTTEKELDTVEVLKAIKKAKEVKDKMNSSEKKISEENSLSAAAPPQISSSSSNHSFSAVSSSSSSSSCSAWQAARPSQEMIREEVVVPTSFLPPLDAAPPPANLNITARNLSADPTQVQPLARSHCGAAATPCAPCRLLVPSHLLSFSTSNKDFISQLSQRLRSAAKEQKEKEEKDVEEGEERSSESTEVQSYTEVSSPSPGSGDGYFEMGLDDPVDELICSASSSSTLLTAPPAEESNPQREEEVQVSRVLWCCCVQVDDTVLQKQACLVLTDRLLGLLYTSGDLSPTNQEAGQTLSVEEVLSSLELDLLLPYSRLLFSSSAHLLDSCLSFGLRSGSSQWFVFAEAEQVRQIRMDLTELIQLQAADVGEVPPASDLFLLPSLLETWDLEESQGGFTAHLLDTSSAPDSSPELPDLLNQMGHLEEGADGLVLPLLLFFTCQHLGVLKVDFTELAKAERCGADPPHPSSWCTLVRVPLGSVVLHPRERVPGDVGGTSRRFCLDLGHDVRQSHTVELLWGGRRLLLLFPLSQDRNSFLGELDQRRASLEGLKMVAFPQCCTACPQRGHHMGGHHGPPGQCCWTCTQTPQGLSSWDSSHLQVEENCPSPHLVPCLSPGLKLLAGLRKQQLLTFFSRYISMSETEEVRQVLWLSVVLYKAPEAELAACLLLSTHAIYFLLEDSASTLSSHSVLDMKTSGETDVCLCWCLSIRLSELLSVNVGLFDQYFRVVGRSAGHVVCCLSRDSYGTGVFLQELMSALSLQQQTPFPEPSEQDFYTQFTNSNTGKMHNYELVHSSRVKFIYPSEEEMGDLTFIVAERQTAPGAASMSTRSSSVLLYLLVFQVQTSFRVEVQIPVQGSSLSGHAHSLSVLGPSPVLEPRTLILTSTHVFLLEEDYISYPLPDFAKEPPSRERYRLREARRIRDLDRVLMGYQTYPQALTLVFDDLPGPDLLCRLTMDHFSSGGEEAPLSGGTEGEVQWCVFVPGAVSRERLISLLARQWEVLCSRELPVELTG
ncbi:nischarin isoform X2 [Thalassophryne amazonica]|uniref:nischarin isoform X2 n=1 Tax=Thalassophryne amazonica TaxID=390379 RepID=UPI001470ABEE|nr:nischarin isoform X2 [Thalassophryne amazonica]